MRKEMRQTTPAALIISRRVHRIRRTRRLLLRPHLGTPDSIPTFEDPASEAHSAAAGHPTVDRTQDAGPGIPRHLQQALLIIGNTGLIPAIRLVKQLRMTVVPAARLAEQGEAFVNQGRLEEALATFDDALKINPSC